VRPCLNYVTLSQAFLSSFPPVFPLQTVAHVPQSGYNKRIQIGLLFLREGNNWNSWISIKVCWMKSATASISSTATA
jgi:hypothetical protein